MAHQQQQQPQQQPPMPIAIVGMSCRLPGDVSTPGEFYRMLCRKRSGWSPVPPDRFNAKAYHHPNPDKKGCFNSQGGYFIKDDISMFDAGFFDITKKEAESMDPAQRLLLECAYEALENAGISKDSVSGKKVGVFVGGNYTEHRVSNLRDLDHIPAFDATGNQGAFLAGRLAYYFNLRGPALTVDTACSSSMHAVHLAVQSIRSGESEQAIVGASHIITHPDIWVSMGKLRLFSDAGKTYAFDHRAKSGYARGEGAGCLILKPLARAQADNDHIFSVITHTGIAHNGRTVGIVAPSPEEQEQLLRNVFAEARIRPEEVGFFETHGTGTKKGDPIEATAIYKAVGKHFTPQEPLYIGSSKANVGHLECASGIVSVIKTVLMLYYGFILPNADFEKVNDAIPLDKWNMRVATGQAPWPGKRKYACVNNFGFSGSNSMCVLSAAPLSRDLELGADGSYSPLRLFVLSANDEPALRKSVKKLGIWLEQHAELYQTTMPRNLAYTLCQRRSHLPWRVAVVAGMCSDVARSLNSPDVAPARAPSEPPRLAFVYTGQGAQWFAMGRELLRTHPVFFEAISRADKALRAVGADFSILEELRRDKTSSKVGLAHISQPICSAVQLALTDLLMSFGIKPSAVTGHSSGEIGAAYAAGALTFESAMEAAYYRGQAIVELKKNHPGLRGTMMAVGAGAEELGPILDALNKQGAAQAVVACENSPSSTTLSGDEEAIDRVAAMFQDKGVFNRKLFVDVAYHSPHMKLIADWYHAKISHIQASAQMASSNVQFFSSLRGQRVSLSSLGPEYWVDNLTQAVRFSTATQHLCTEHSPDILIEIGPHAALKGPILQILKTLGPVVASKISYLPTLVRGQDATRTCLETAGQLFVRGYPLQFFEINHHREEAEKPALVPSLYTYPWSRQKYWYESRISRQHRLKPSTRQDLLGSLADWSSELEPTWRNVVRTDDLPWLKEYQVHGRMVFPVAGFISMVIEAAAQRACLEGLDADQFEVRNFKVVDQLFLAEGLEFEVVLHFRPLEGGEDRCYEFGISSYEASRGWQKHCTGTVTADCLLESQHQASPADMGASLQTDPAKPPINEDRIDALSDSASSISKPPSSAASDTSNVPGTPDTLSSTGPWGRKSEWPDTAVYDSLRSIGMSYPKSFQTLLEATANETDTAARYRARDTASDMPMEFETPYKVHPSLIDAMLQIPLLSLKLEGMGMGNKGDGSAYLPTGIRHLIVRPGFSKRASEDFSAHSSRDARTGAFVVDSFCVTDPAMAVISIAGLEFKAWKPTIPEPAAPRELCFKFDWEPLKEESTSSAEKAGRLKSRESIVIVAQGQDAPRNPLVAAVARKIEQSTGIKPHITPLEKIDDWNNFFVVLSELSGPILCSITETGLEQVKRLLTLSPGLMWVTRGATRFTVAPNASMALGMTRTARSERNAVASTLDLDPDSKLGASQQAELICEAFARSVLSESDDGEGEMEFAEDGGGLVVPRIVVDKELNLDVHRSLGPAAPYRQDFHQRDRQLRLAAHANANLSSSDDSLYFEDAPPAPPLADDEVEIELSASLLTPDDVTYTHGATEANIPILRSCSGTVTRIGRKVCDVSVGNRVCALADGPFGTHARAKITSTAIIPPAAAASLSMEEAASIPAAFSAAYYALVHIAKVQPGERVLVQLSAPAGVAAIEIARYLGASVFALAKNEKEVTAATDCGVPLDRVLDVRTKYLRRQVDDATQGEGMEVVLALSGNVQGTVEASECLAEFGRFVEIRTSGSHRSSRAELGINATFTSLNIASIAAARPQAMEETLRSLMKGIETGAILPPAKPVVVPVSELGKGLRMVSEGAVQPVVAVAGAREQVKALHRVSKTIFRSDGTHVIIGGTGGLGRSMAKYMIDHGARNIVLLSRRGADDEMVEQLQRAAQCPDGKIVVMKCDASIESQVWRVVGECATTMPPICGVIHAAMVLRDVLLEGMTHEDYKRVTRPKVNGIWNIHKALVAYYAKLDYFVVLSSAAGILGSRGQGAYAAANTFLDSFVQYRVQNGLPGTSLDLTAVTGAGYLAENAERQDEIIRNFGGETLSEEEFLALLSAAVRGVCGSQCLTGLKLHLGSDGQWPYYASDARFAKLKAECLAAAEREGLAPKQSVSLGNAFRAAKSDEEATNIAAQGVLEKLSEVLTIEVQNLDVARNITSYGLDSLTAIELRNWIAKELRANLQILELLSSGTINDLAALIVQKTRTV